MTRRAQLADLFRRYHSVVMYVLLKTCDHELAEEATCKMWLNMAMARSLPEDVGKNYLLTSARREVSELIRARADRDRWLAANGLLLTWVDRPVILDGVTTKDTAGDIFYAAPVNVEEEALARVEAGELLREVAGWTEAQRRPWSGYLAGLSYAEIAEAEGITETNVNRHLAEGRTRLREAGP